MIETTVCSRKASAYHGRFLNKDRPENNDRVFAGDLKLRGSSRLEDRKFSIANTRLRN